MPNEPSGVVLANTIATLPAGINPFGVAISKVDSKLFVASGKMVVVYAMEYLKNGTIRYSRQSDIPLIPPAQDVWLSSFMACSPTEHKAYVTVDANVHFVESVDTKDNKSSTVSYLPILNTISKMAFSPDGKKCYVPNGNQLLVIDEQPTSATPKVVPIPLSVFAEWVAVTNDGAYAYCGGLPFASPVPNSHVSRVDLVAGKEKDLVQDLFDSVTSFDVSFDNTKLFVGNDDGIDIVDIAQNRKIKTIRESGRFAQMACSKVSPRACFAGTSSDGTAQFIQVVDTINDTLLHSIPMPGLPTCIAFDRLGNAYVTTTGVTVVPHFKLMSA